MPGSRDAGAARSMGEWHIGSDTPEIYYIPINPRDSGQNPGKLDFRGFTNACQIGVKRRNADSTPLPMTTGDGCNH